MAISLRRLSVAAGLTVAVALVSLFAWTRATAVSEEVANTCLQDDMPDTVARTFTINSKAEFRAAFPKAGETPELEQMKGQLTVVVYGEGYPGVVWYDPGEGGGPEATIGHQPEPGTVDVCVQSPDGGTIVYANIPLE